MASAVVMMVVPVTVVVPEVLVLRRSRRMMMSKRMAKMTLCPLLVVCVHHPVRHARSMCGRDKCCEECDVDLNGRRLVVVRRFA